MSGSIVGSSPDRVVAAVFSRSSYGKLTFKETADQDIEDAFVNLHEFADPHVIDGKRVDCVIDTILTQGGPKNLGVFINQLRIFIREGLIKTPVEGKQIRVDSQRYLVRSVSREMGMIVITAERNSQ